MFEGLRYENRRIPDNVTPIHDTLLMGGVTSNSSVGITPWVESKSRPRAKAMAAASPARKRLQASGNQSERNSAMGRSKLRNQS